MFAHFACDVTHLVNVSPIDCLLPLSSTFAIHFPDSKTHAELTGRLLSGVLQREIINSDFTCSE